MTVTNADGYEQLEDVPAGVTHVRSRRGVLATMHEHDGRRRGERWFVVYLFGGDVLTADQRWLLMHTVSKFSA